MKKTLVATSLTLALLSATVPTSVMASEKGEVTQIQLPSISQVANEKVNVKLQSFSVMVSNYEDYKKSMFRLYTELPRTMTIKTKVSKDQMDEFSKKFKAELVAVDLPNFNLLAHYKMKKVGNLYTYTDNSHKKFSAKQIETYVGTFASRFAKNIEHLSPSERLQTIYDYVYSNFEYNAIGYQYMMVGNAYEYEMACNGFSRLMYEMLNAAGIKTKIIEGEDHYYNLVSFQDVFEEEGKTSNFQRDDWFVVDVTTDILVKKPHGATGKAMNDYLAYVVNTNLYTAKPIVKESNKHIKLNDEQLMLLIDDLGNKNK